MYFSIKYRYSDILLQTLINLIYNRLFCCNHTCYCVNMVFVTSASRYITSASRYHQRYQSRSLMYIRGLIPRNWPRQFLLIILVCLKTCLPGDVLLFPNMYTRNVRQTPGGFKAFSKLYQRHSEFSVKYNDGLKTSATRHFRASILWRFDL